MATDIKLVFGWVEQQQVRARGGRAATRASNIKLQSSERLSDLVGGTAVGRGVENTDDMKAGTLTPEIRMDILRTRISGMDARLAAMGTELTVATQEGATDAKILGIVEAAKSLRTRRENAVGELISIMRDLTEAETE